MSEQSDPYALILHRLDEQAKRLDEILEQTSDLQNPEWPEPPK